VPRVCDDDGGGRAEAFCCAARPLLLVIVNGTLKLDGPSFHSKEYSNDLSRDAYYRLTAQDELYESADDNPPVLACV
jgi:hypothetical protein